MASQVELLETKTRNWKKDLVQKDLWEFISYSSWLDEKKPKELVISSDPEFPIILMTSLKLHIKQMKKK